MRLCVKTERADWAFRTGEPGAPACGRLSPFEPCKPAKCRRSARQRGSLLVIVMWIAFGLVSLALYFGNSMNFELRASDNRVSAMAADQAIEGAVHYLSYLLTTQIANGSNGVFLNLNNSLCQAVPVGDSHYWLIDRKSVV